LSLVESGLSLNEVSSRLGVSRAAIREWRARGPAESRAASCPAPVCPSPAYAALLGFYLGDGCVSQHPRTHDLRISCDASYPGIIDDVARCIEAVHPGRPVFRTRAPGVVVVKSYWKHWPCLFPQHGPGRKHGRKIRLEDWQWDVVRAHPWDFLRGLFHSDGCRVNNWATRMVAGQRKRYDYPRWQFTNESADIIGLCADALDLVDVGWRRSHRRTLSVSTRDGVRLLDQHLGLKR
jgi:hypothetical protein